MFNKPTYKFVKKHFWDKHSSLFRGVRKFLNICFCSLICLQSNLPTYLDSSFSSILLLLMLRHNHKQSLHALKTFLSTFLRRHDNKDNGIRHYDTQPNNLNYDECHYGDCHYTECHYAECHYAEYH